MVISLFLVFEGICMYRLFNFFIVVFKVWRGFGNCKDFLVFCGFGFSNICRFYFVVFISIEIVYRDLFVFLGF